MMKQRVIGILGLLLCACGAADPGVLIREGQSALASGKSDVALEKFDAALGVLDKQDARYVDARLGVIEARIAGDSKAARDEFIRFARECPGEADGAAYLHVSGMLASAREYSEALELLHAGIADGLPDSPALLALAKRIELEREANRPIIGHLPGCQCNFGP